MTVNENSVPILYNTCDGRGVVTGGLREECADHLPCDKPFLYRHLRSVMGVCEVILAKCLLSCKKVACKKCSCYVQIVFLLRADSISARGFGWSK